MEKEKVGEKPLWGNKLRWQATSRQLVVTCRGCRGNVLKKRWSTHPMKCSNVYEDDCMKILKTQRSKNQTLKQNKQLSVSRQARLQYSEQSVSIVPSEPVVKEIKVSRSAHYAEKDYMFQLIPLRKYAYYQNKTVASMLPKRKKIRKITAQGYTMCTGTPKLVRKAKKVKQPPSPNDQFGRLFINDWTLPTTYRSFLLFNEASQQEDANKQIKVPKPRSVFCNICSVQFEDYFLHIVEPSHKQNLKNNLYGLTDIRIWMEQLPSFTNKMKKNKLKKKRRSVSIKQEDPNPNFSCQQVKLFEQNEFQAQIIQSILFELKKALNDIDLSKVCHKIKIAAKNKKVRPGIVRQAIKKCVICQRVHSQNENQLQCSDCGAKFHETCISRIQNYRCSCLFSTIAEIGQGFSFPTVCLQECLDFIQDDCGIKAKNLKRQNLGSIQDEEKIKKVLKKRGISYQRDSIWHSCARNLIKLQHDPFLKRANFDIMVAYSDYLSGRYFPPVEPRLISKKVGFGVFTNKKITKGTLICEYSGDIVSGNFVRLNPSYNMDLFEGRTPEESLLITVLTVSSLGPLINHSQDANCASLRILLNDEPKVVIYSRKDIGPGVQLTYCYNSASFNYPTRGFDSF